MDDLFETQPCAICSGKTEHKLTDLTFEADDITIVITGVPVAVCLECGEEYVPGPLGVLISDKVAEVADRLRPVVERDDILKSIVITASLSDSSVSYAAESPIWATA